MQLLRYLGTPKNAWGPALEKHRVGERYAPGEEDFEGTKDIPSFLREIRKREAEVEEEEMREMENIDLSSYGSGEKFTRIDFAPKNGEESSITAFPFQCSSGQDLRPSNSSQVSDPSLPVYQEITEKIPNDTNSKLKKDLVLMTDIADGSEAHI